MKTKSLSKYQRAILRSELARQDLSVYTVVRMAREDLACGNFDAAVARIAVDMDKIRMHSPELARLIADRNFC